MSQHHTAVVKSKWKTGEACLPVSTKAIASLNIVVSGRRREIFDSCDLASSDIRLLRFGVERYSPLAIWRRAIFASRDLASSDIRFLRFGVERYSPLAILRLGSALSVKGFSEFVDSV